MINILMIEDDAELASILTNYLSQYNIKITNFETPELGISALNLKKYDLIILDLSLPNIDGIEVCKMIRQKHDTPIIISSARSYLGDKIACFLGDSPEGPCYAVVYIRYHARAEENGHGPARRKDRLALAEARAALINLNYRSVAARAHDLARYFVVSNIHKAHHRQASAAAHGYDGPVHAVYIIAVRIHLL